MHKPFDLELDAVTQQFPDEARIVARIIRHGRPAGD
jgi:hypothetical protein